MKRTWLLAALMLLLVALPASASDVIDKPKPDNCKPHEWDGFTYTYELMTRFGWTPMIETIAGADRMYVQVRLPEIVSPRGKVIYTEVVVTGLSIKDVPQMLVKAYYDRMGPFPGEVGE